MDIKAKNSKGEIIIVEIQNTRELYYLEQNTFLLANATTKWKRFIPLAFCTSTSEKEMIIYIMDRIASLEYTPEIAWSNNKRKGRSRP